ncbi:MAG: acetolactate synthase [Acidimicrobiales bacterium]|nr:acetolactate synthase [Acidimicrobiales bacterium]
MPAVGRRGRDAVLEVLRSEGVTHLFGNPGTTELPLLDALVEHDGPRYVLALQEATAVGMADGYAMATGRPAVLNLHTSAGLGNAVGNLTNAAANRTPLVVTAGQQDRRHRHHDPLLSGDLVGIASPTCKVATEVTSLDGLGTVLRRAFTDAVSPPAGPVFVSLPMDLLDEVGDAPVPPRSRVERAAVGAGLATVAERLVGSAPERVALVAGDEVAAAGGVDALVALAEVIGCRVHGSPLHSTTVFPTASPQWAGPLPPSADGIAKALERYDVVLLVGGQAFLVYHWSPGPALPEGTALLHLSPDATAIGRAWPAEIGVVGDPRASLEALLPLVAAAMDPSAAAAARGALAAAAEEAAAGFAARARARYDDVPTAPAAAAHALLTALPPDTRVVDEAITTGTYVRGFHRTTQPGRYFFCRGGGLGWGMPAALGVSLGAGREPVLCVVGDGSAMYSPQALWTAVHEGLPVVFAVVDNREYRILKGALSAREDASAARGTFLGMDLDDPPVDFLALARSMGVPGTRVERAGDIGDAVRTALDAGGPALLHLPIAAR